MKSDENMGVSEDKSVPNYEKDGGIQTSTSDPEFGEGETQETTKRGLKARHAQMIALGGTIGMLRSDGYIFRHI